MCELAVSQAEVPNAASLALAVLALSETGLAEQARAVGCGRTSSPNTHTPPQQPRPPSATIHRPFLHILLLGNTTFICIELSAPSNIARDTFVDALHRSGCTGKETRDKCARVKESDRIRRPDDPVTSPYILFHRTAIAGHNSHQIPYSLVHPTTLICANESVQAQD